MSKRKKRRVCECGDANCGFGTMVAAAIAGASPPSTWVEGREAPRQGGFTPHALEMDRAAAALPDIEACARAAYDAAHGGIPRYRWDAPEGDYSVRSEVKDVYRAVARAVLAAAGGGK